MMSCQWAVRVVLLLAVTHVVLCDPCHFDPNDQSHLRCLTRTLQSGVDLMPEATLQTAEKLTIKCEDLFFTESRLSTNHFGHLPDLKSLQIEQCKVREVPERAFAGLDNLERLSMTSHNNEWAAMALEFEDRALAELVKVKEISLASNNLWRLPSRSLCTLKDLQALDLSRNHLLEFADLGLDSTQCKSSVQFLDISHNFLGSLTREELNTVPYLVTLNVSNNQLIIMGDNALDDLTSLKELNLANNQLAALPPKLFGKSSKLEVLHLQNNSFTLLPSELFAGLSHLRFLNLSHNAIASHHLEATGTDKIFSGLEDSLQVLDLSHNKLSRIEPETFRNLKHLRTLIAHHNEILSISADSFASQKLVETVVLSYNKISSLPDQLCPVGSQLKSLVLDHNDMTSLDDNIFRHCPMLEDLALDNNKMQTVPRAISSGHLDQLRTLDLGENLIEFIRVGDLANLTDLYGLRLSGNKLKTIEKNVFTNLTGLNVLNLARNDLVKIAAGAFDGSKATLKALRLDNNKLGDLNGVVTSLDNLKWLNVSSNNLQWFDYAFVPFSLEWLDIHDNKIEDLGNYYRLTDGFQLKTIDASLNRIKKLTNLSLPSSLETILIGNNRISDIESRIFMKMSDLKFVDLSHNNVSKVGLSSLFIGSPSNNRASQPEFKLSGNPFTCDCEMDWLKEINSISLNGDHARVIDLEDVTCQLIDNANNNSSLVMISVLEMEPEQFLCPYKTHCFPQCLCCDFFACDCRMQCPDGCECLHDAGWSANIIQCSSRDRKDVPLLIPMDATEIRLDGNQFGDVDTQSFIGRRRVRALYLNASHVTGIARETFGGLAGLEILHLEDNLIKELVGHEFNALTSLRELYLQNNDLVHIGSHTFDPLVSLAVLRLDGNLLTTFPAWNIIRANPFLDEIFLSHNMWSCKCQFLSSFKQFLTSHKRRVIDLEDIVCMADNLTEHAIDLANKNQTCENVILDKYDADKALVQKPAEIDSEFVPIVVSAVLAFVAVLIGFLAICVFRAKIKRWLYNKSSDIYDSRSSNMSSNGSCYANQASNNSKLFDVYITYSVKDSEFVDHSLAPTLEHGSSSYKLCLHQRDFPPSASLYDTVSVATESSARVILVLSRAYLETEWPHIKIPLRNALSKDTALASSKLILLFLEDLSEEDLTANPELKTYVKTCASVRWGSAGFLNKLRFFLPEPAFLTFQRNVTLRTLQPANLLMNGPGVDQVSGVWNYSLKAKDISPVSSVVTQSTTDEHLRYQQQHQQQQFLQQSVGQPFVGAPPSVISSLYSHHTYQSIPENHIYHTLEPNLLIHQQHQQQKDPVWLHNAHMAILQEQQKQKLQLQENGPKDQLPAGSVYINRNLDLVLKEPNEFSVRHESQASALSAQRLLSNEEKPHVEDNNFDHGEEEEEEEEEEAEIAEAFRAEEERSSRASQSSSTPSEKKPEDEYIV